MSDRSREWHPDVEWWEGGPYEQYIRYTGGFMISACEKQGRWSGRLEFGANVIHACSGRTFLTVLDELEEYLP